MTTLKEKYNYNGIYYRLFSLFQQYFTDNLIDIDYFMTEFRGIVYMFQVFGTTETKFWFIPPKNSSSSKIAKNFLAENVLLEL